MGFNFDPYRHVELVAEQSQTEPGLTVWHLHCHNCGAESIGNFNMSSRLLEIVLESDRHIRESHGNLPADFKDWPVL